MGETDPTKLLAGKKALVTGGARGIGKAVALKLAENGAEVVINYLRNDEAARQTQALAELTGGRAHLAKGDMGRPPALKKVLEEVKQKLGALDILVHAAALGAFKPITEINVLHWNVSLDVNARALLLCAQEALGLMEGRNARIVGISSLGSHRYIPHYGAIGVSKAALETLIRYLAVELAPRGIRVNGVSGGLVETEALQMHPLYHQQKEEAIRRTPAGRIGTPEDIAKVVLFLVSPQSDWIFGQTLIADGGLDLV